eukprot:c5257_g1_i1 orf=1-252(-)
MTTIVAALHDDQSIVGFSHPVQQLIDLFLQFAFGRALGIYHQWCLLCSVSCTFCLRFATLHLTHVRFRGSLRNSFIWVTWVCVC